MASPDVASPDASKRASLGLLASGSQVVSLELYQRSRSGLTWRRRTWRQNPCHFLFLTCICLYNIGIHGIHLCMHMHLRTQIHVSIFPCTYVLHQYHHAHCCHSFIRSVLSLILVRYWLFALIVYNHLLFFVIIFLIILIPV